MSQVNGEEISDSHLHYERERLRNAENERMCRKGWKKTVLLDLRDDSQNSNALHTIGGL